MSDSLMSRLWLQQRSAVQVVDDFLRARGGSEGPSALVRMPTGTGKSGVIAIAAQQLVPAADVLLLTQVLAASRQPRPRPEVVQMLYSLQSTWAAVSSVGAQLRLLSSA